MLRFLVRVGLVAALLTLSAGYDGYKFYEVVPETPAQCDLLYRHSVHSQEHDYLKLSRVPMQPTSVLVPPTEEVNFIRFLQDNGMQFKVVDGNVGKSIKTEFLKNQESRTMRNFSGKGRLTNDRYYTYEEINNYIEDLARRFPRRVFVKTIGRSYEGRLLKTVTITNGDRRANKNVILLDGGFHAREWISPAAVLYVIDQLVESYEENADVLLEYDWIILPVVNPDGYEYTQRSPETRMWRKTRKPYNKGNIICYGADPNRNFEIHWNEVGASSDPCSDVFAGPKPFSEPEAVVLRDLMHTLNSSGHGMMYLTLHSFGNYLLYPWGWTYDLPRTWKDLDDVAVTGREAIKAYNGTFYLVGSSTNVLYPAAGGSDDYAYSLGFPIAITMELPAGGSTGFDPPASMIDTLVKETWVGIRAMTQKVTRQYIKATRTFF